MSGLLLNTYTVEDSEGFIILNLMQLKMTM